MKNNKKLKQILIIVIIIVAILIGGVSIYFNNNLASKQSSDKVVMFSIKAGDNLNTIVDRLYDKKLIKDKTATKIAAKLQGDSNFSVGNYEIRKNWSSTHMLEHLADPKNIVYNQVSLTFREGIWAKDIAKIIGENTNVSEQELLALWNDETFLKKAIKKYEFLTDAILNPAYKVKLEGYLFPETYMFNKKTTPEEITYTFLDEFNKVYQKLKPRIKKSKLSVEEIVTLASVIQYESATKKDMRMVSGVFYNRLKQHQRLQSSATVCYAIYNYNNWQDCETQTTIDSPYNTYTNDGLPVGPILNPGYDALKAAVDPDKNDYLFFVADVKHDGKVYYSKTYEEHLKLIDKYGLNL